MTQPGEIENAYTAAVAAYDAFQEEQAAAEHIPRSALLNHLDAMYKAGEAAVHADAVGAVAMSNALRPRFRQALQDNEAAVVQPPFSASQRDSIKDRIGVLSTFTQANGETGDTDEPEITTEASDAVEATKEAEPAGPTDLDKAPTGGRKGAQAK